MKALKILLYILVPSVFVAAVGTYFGYLQFVEGIKRGMDESDNYQWAILAGFLCSPLGLIPGLILDLFIWLITNEPKTKTVS